MGKKRERRLQAEIDALTTRVSQLVRANDETANQRSENLAAAHREMREDWFAIITKSGRVVRGKAESVEASYTPIEVTFGGDSFRKFMPGPRELSAQIIIEPIK